MTDYFSEYSTFVGSKGLPSPAGTPYETPDYIRSKRSSRATTGSSRDQSSSPPPLPPDANETQERARDGRYGALDPRRFTPTLHASLVSEILSLRRELDSKNHLVDNLETTLADSKNENETLHEQLSQQSREVRKAKLQVQQIEKGTYDAVEDLAKERDLALANIDDLRSKLETAQRASKRQDEDAERTQRIWEGEKESWDSERRQLERRIHVTETRLRAVVEEMTLQHAAGELNQPDGDESGENQFKDSGFGNESDAGSIRNVSPAKHKRNASSISFKTRTLRDSAGSRATGTPEPYARMGGNSLADELGIDEEDEYDVDELDQQGEELELEFSERLRKTMESRQSMQGDVDSKAKRVLGLTTESVDSPLPSPTKKEFPRRLASPVDVLNAVNQQDTVDNDSKDGAARTVEYVDTGYQPSPPPSPPQARGAAMDMPIPRIREPSAERAADKDGHPEATSTVLEASSPGVATLISPPQSPDRDVLPDKAVPPPTAPPKYNTASTQTERAEVEEHKRHQSRDSLSPPDYVPSIAIHPSSRPSSPRAYVLPPGTKNAFTQANLRPKMRNAAVQTEGIRVDKRPLKLPPHLLPGYLLPSPPLPESAQSRLLKRASAVSMAKITTKSAATPSAQSSAVQSPMESSPEKASRNSSSKDSRNMPLRAIPLPRPVLSPVAPPVDSFSEGPLNRSSQYGVTKPALLISPLLDVDRESELSDTETHIDGFDPQDLGFSLPGIIRPPQGRFGLSEPPKAVPEDKEISPERRPSTSGSFGAAPAPSVSSSRANSTRARGAKPTRLNSYKDMRSRSPSFGSRASSSYSTQSAAPPFPIPTRSSSRIVDNTQSEGSQSPTPYYADVFGNRSQRYSRASSSKQASLRKVQSAAVIRQSGRRGSPKKSRRRRHSPDLTPVQSMAFESPAPTKFPFPDLPTPVQTNSPFDYTKGSVDLGEGTAVSSTPRVSEETNLVDAIAATMVGEWMWKYIRRKKSFGVQEDFPIAEDGSVNITAGSTRHKRWVWLSPYERTIMWDSKQPITNSALLGKKGRKLSIQSVLDVQDKTALPKNPELHSAYNRSILILTPARALKFTAVSAERHALWMTALSFLAQSGRLPSQIPPLPSQAPQLQGPVIATQRVPRIPEREPAPVKRNRSPSFGRLTVRDSIRLAKGKRPELPKSLSNRSVSSPSAVPELDDATRDDSADFPAVPRLYSGTHRHQRKRSNTSPRLPATINGFRSFSSTAISSASSIGLHPPSNNSSFFRSNLPNNSSKTGSRHDSMASPDQPNFFEAVGTVRMEAFVDPNVRDGVLYVPAPPPSVAAEPRRRRGDSNISQMSIEKRRAGHVFDDPFKSFDFTAANEIPAR